MVFCVGCSVITGDSGRIVAIEIDGEPARNVEENDSIILNARAISAAGDTVSDATIEWELLDPDQGLSVDVATGVLRALFPGHGRVRARVDNLRSDTISVEVTAAPDSIAESGDTRIVFGAAAELSPDIVATVIDLTTNPQSPQPLAAKPVSFSVTDPPPGSDDAQGFFLTEAIGNGVVDPHTITVLTDREGLATISVGRVAGALLPDSAVIEAVAITAIGDTVPGSPVTYTVVFERSP